MATNFHCHNFRNCGPLACPTFKSFKVLNQLGCNTSCVDFQYCKNPPSPRGTTSKSKSTTNTITQKCDTKPQKSMEIIVLGMLEIPILHDNVHELLDMTRIIMYFVTMLAGEHGAWSCGRCQYLTPPIISTSKHWSQDHALPYNATWKIVALLEGHWLEVHQLECPNNSRKWAWQPWARCQIEAPNEVQKLQWKWLWPDATCLDYVTTRHNLPKCTYNGQHENPNITIWVASTPVVGEGNDMMELEMVIWTTNGRGTSPRIKQECKNGIGIWGSAMTNNGRVMLCHIHTHHTSARKGWKYIATAIFNFLASFVHMKNHRDVASVLKTQPQQHGPKFEVRFMECNNHYASECLGELNRSW